MNREKIIFFGNGPLAEYAKNILEKHFEIIFHAREKSDLETVKTLKRDIRDAHGILASFGVMIKEDVLELFEPEGILNIHPSLLPKYRGASPIETAILNGDKNFSVSIMKLVSAMDAGPIYFQETFSNMNIVAMSARHRDNIIVDLSPFATPTKDDIYCALASSGAIWLVENLKNLPKPKEQNEKLVTFTKKLDKSMSNLTPETDTAEKTLRKIIAFQGFPKPKYPFYGQNCIILAAHLLNPSDTAVLTLKCADGEIIAIDKLQPEGRKPMDAKSFLNGYKK